MNTAALALAVLYFITGKITFFLMGNNDIVTLSMFPPEGIALAFALYFGKKVLPGIFIGQFLLAFYSGIAFLPSVLIALINTAEAWIGIKVYKYLKIDIKLPTFNDYLKLFLMIALVLQPFSAVFSNIVLYFLQGGDFLYKLFAWWFGNVMGQMVFTPFLLLLFTRYHLLDIKKLLFYGFIYAVFMWVIEIFFKVENPFVLIVYSLPIVIFLTIKEGLVYGWFLSIVSAFIALYAVHLKTGAFANLDAFDNTFNYNFFVLLHSFSVLIIDILFEERKNYEKNLEDRIKEEVKKNNEKMLMLMQQNRHAQMGETISMIAHQWRQPLNSLVLINQILINRIEKNALDDKTLEYFKVNSKKQIEYMSKTIDDFRNFFKKEKEKKVFEINKVIQKSVDMIKPQFEKHGINIQLDMMKNLTYKGFANNLMQVIINILNNAKDVLLEKEIKNKQIEIKSYKDGEDIIITIEDNAGGIDEEIIEQIFEPYFSTKSKNGSGLGLYMAKEIIEKQMHGVLKVINTDKGAKFIIILKPE